MLQQTKTEISTFTFRFLKKEMLKITSLSFKHLKCSRITSCDIVPGNTQNKNNLNSF